ncbi:MAG TPA: hypothetical protein VFB84_15115 [Micromonosporaceae bacterium]|nr:hypothetical protein [Micromonosporaceae bacterium]
MTVDEAVGERAVTYRPRSITTQTLEEVRGWTVKRYAVSALREAPPEPVHELARRAVQMSLPPAYPDALCYAYSVVHEDEDGCYVVVGWWSPNRVILHTRTWLAGWDDLTTVTPAGNNATACIWELVPMAHERQAWVRHVVTNNPPDLPAYRTDVVSGWF